MKWQASQARRERQSLPAWAWLLAGVALGILLGGAVIWRERVREPSPAPAVSAPPEPVSAPAERRPRYDFYTILPEQAVVVPAEELAPTVTGASAETASAGGAVILQVGSFREGRDAEALKARLALLGQVAHVTPAAIDGATWYRVRIGPIADAHEAEAIRRRLREHGIDSIVLREASR